MDLSTLSCLPPPPSAASPTRLRRYGAGTSRPGRSCRAWSSGAGTTRRRSGGRLRVEALFGDGGGGGEDGFRAVMRIVKLNSAIQNRSGTSRPGRSCRAWSSGAGTTRRRSGGRLRVEALFGDGGGGGEDGFRAVMRIVKLNSAIQNRSVRELLELVGDECRYFFRNIPPVSVPEMSKSVFLFLHEMMLRHQVSFVLKPAENGGFDLGVKWSLEWKGKKLPWDVDCTVSTTHVYTGLLLVSQVNKACGPLLQRILQMIYQNLDAVVLIVANKFLPDGTLDEKERSNIIVCAIIGLVVMVLFYAMFNNL